MKFTRLPHVTRTRIVDCFIEDIGAAPAARLLSLNRKTLNTWYSEVRNRLYSLERPLVLDARVCIGFHRRRVAVFNGLDRRFAAKHLRESEFRFVHKRGFRKLVLKLTDDLTR